MTEEDKAWEKYRHAFWAEIPVKPCLLLLGKVKREWSEPSYLNGLDWAMKRKRPSKKLIALAVAEKLKGKT